MAAALLVACSKEKKSERNITLGDTITTKSGLQYIFLKEGLGRKIEAGSKVKVFTDLYLNDADTTIWTTAEDKDSVFAFVHRKTSLIKGFTELHDYLREGDEVIGILPDSLAYGEKGRGIVPPKATLVYNPLVVKFVSEPKQIMTDTLLSIAASKDVTAAISFYENVASSDLKNKYHSSVEDVLEVLGEFAKDSLYKEMEAFSKHFMPKSVDANMTQTLSYYSVVSLRAQGRIKEAVEMVKPLTQGALNKDYWNGILTELQKEQKK